MKRNSGKEDIKEQLESALANIVVEDDAAVEEAAQETVVKTPVEMIDEERLKIDKQEYLIVLNHKEGFQTEKLGERYNSILSKYDYIVGDWGYDQLRLSGFYRDSHSKAPFEKKIGYLQDFLYEFCNFGCAYFVLEKVKDGRDKPSKSKRRRRSSRKEQTHTESTKVETPVPSGAKTPGKPRKRREETKKQSDTGNQTKQFSIKEEPAQNSKPKPQNKTVGEKRKPRPKKTFKIRETE